MRVEGNMSRWLAGVVVLGVVLHQRRHSRLWGFFLNSSA
jgi:hypothetical protein